jgi:hypothetical protein
VEERGVEKERAHLRQTGQVDKGEGKDMRREDTETDGKGRNA